jgi:GR25 family glycosyltransferase involved in LPS biosynthesis
MTETGFAGTAEEALAWDGYYINLDRSPERRERMEAEFARNGLTRRYSRFPAVDGNGPGCRSPLQPGEVGCFRSHLDLMKLIASNGRIAHVLEDDVVVCDLTAPAIDAIVKRRILEEFDLLFLSTPLGNDLNSFRKFHPMYEEAGRIERADELKVIDLGENYIYGLDSFVVGPKGLEALVSCLEAEWERGPMIPVDVVIRDEIRARRIRAACVFPFVTAPHLESTRANTTTPLTDRNKAMISPLLRYVYFARRDLTYATQVLDETLQTLEIDASDEAIEFYVRVLTRYLDIPKRSPKG